MGQAMLRPTNGARRIDTEALKAERPLVDVVAAYQARPPDRSTFEGLLRDLELDGGESAVGPTDKDPQSSTEGVWAPPLPAS